MRYTDEGNLRFVGNTRTSTSTQGVYRQEFDSGKWAVTLTNTEPGIGYLGYNVEALSYDFENCRLCTGNIRASCIEVSGSISAPYVNALDTIITQCLESCCGLGFECGCISNGPAEIRLYGRPNCSPDNGCLVVADNYLCYCTRNGCASIVVDSDGASFHGPINADTITSGVLTLGQVPGESAIYDSCGNIVFCSRNGHIDIRGNFYSTDPEYDYQDRSIISMGGSNDLCIKSTYTDETREVIVNKNCITLHYDDDNGWAGLDIWPDRCEAHLSVSRRADSKPFIFCDNGTFKTSAPDLLLENDVVVDDLYTSTDHTCHYLYGIRKNGSDTFTNSGILDIGTVGAAVNVNGSNYVAGDNGLISLPNMTTSVTLNNVTTPVDSTGNINLGTLTATVDLNNTNSLFITNCTFSNPPYSSIVIGHNACAAVDSRPGYYATRYSVAIGDGAEVCGESNVAIGYKTYASGSSTAIGDLAKAYCISTSIGPFTCSCNNALALGAYAHASCKNVAIGFRAIADCTNFNYITTKTESCIYTGSSYKEAGFGSTQILIKNNTLECDLYKVLQSIIKDNLRTSGTTAYNKNLLLLDKAIYRDVNDLSILGSGDYNASITYASDYISIGSRMTVHSTCESAISLKCANSYEVWNILF